MEATGVNMETFLEVNQDKRGGNTLDLVLTSQTAMVENLQEHFLNGDHNFITLERVSETFNNNNNNASLFILRRLHLDDNERVITAL